MRELAAAGWPPRRTEHPSRGWPRRRQVNNAARRPYTDTASAIDM